MLDPGRVPHPPRRGSDGKAVSAPREFRQFFVNRAAACRPPASGLRRRTTPWARTLLAASLTEVSCDAMIRFRDVNKWFGKIHVLRDVNLEVPPGQVVVVCGPSGSGKSTLIRTINKLEPIDRGQLVVDGQDLGAAKLAINKLRAEIG